jgi:menaquinone-dependent protoporphyrinogen oxidase
MSSILVVYGTSYGHTRQVVDRLALGLTTHGHDVTIWKGDALPVPPALGGFDGFLIAGSVLYGKHQRYLRDFARQNAARLNASPSAFVSVCGALAGTWARGQEEARKYVAKFLEQTGWRPRITTSVAGALPYTKYGLVTRWMMRLISKATGRPTDTSRDWELTDWEAVDRFGAELARIFAGAPTAQPRP